MGENPKNKSDKNDLNSKRELAKAGMTLSMGTLVATGLIQGRYSRNIHIVSGLALIGFSWWHASLYTAKPKRGASL